MLEDRHVLYGRDLNNALAPLLLFVFVFGLFSSQTGRWNGDIPMAIQQVTIRYLQNLRSSILSC